MNIQHQKSSIANNCGNCVMFNKNEMCYHPGTNFIKTSKLLICSKHLATEDFNFNSEICNCKSTLTSLLPDGNKYCIICWGVVR